MSLPAASAPAPTELVSLASLAVSNQPRLVLATGPLGAGLGVVVWDPAVRAGGLLHTLLPDSNLELNRAAARPEMFVNTGVAALVQAVGRLRAEPSRLQVCVAGGAQLLDEEPFFDLGRRNYEALKQVLERLGLRLCAERVGGLANLAVSLELPLGIVRVQASGQKGEQLLWRSQSGP